VSKFRELDPMVGRDRTDEELDADLAEDIADLKRRGNHAKARELEDALRSRREARGVPVDEWIPELPFDSADYLDGSAWSD
jgi:hypothetical protein